MTEEDLPRLRARCAGNRSVVTKLTSKVEVILQKAERDTKARDRLQKIDTMLKGKTTLINQLDDQIVALCKVEEIEKEIEEAEELKVRVMDTRADISDIMKATPLHTTKVNLVAGPAETTMPNLVQDNVQEQEIPPMSSGSSQGMPSLNHFSPD